jgi:hypothetical protein
MDLPPPVLKTGWHNLPAELRLMIYSFTLEPRKVVMTRKKPIDWEKFCREGCKDVYKYRVYSPPPPILHLSAEAREFTLRHLVPFLETAESVAYFNPSLDLLILEVFPDQGFRRLGQDESIPPNETARRFLTMLSVVRHINFNSRDRHLYYALQLALLDGSLPALRTLDLCCPKLNLVAGGEPKLLWGRWCCMPNCAQRCMSGQLHRQLFLNKGRWKFHKTSYPPEQVQKVVFPLRTCKELMEGR